MGSLGRAAETRIKKRKHVRGGQRERERERERRFGRDEKNENRAVERKSAWNGWNELNRESDDEVRVAEYANAIVFFFVLLFSA